MECAFESCARPVHCRGLCDGHYQQQRKGSPLKPLRQVTKGGSAGPCRMQDCDRKAEAKNLCGPHYFRHLRGKEVEGPIQVQLKGGSSGTCSYEGCSNKAAARFLCGGHVRLLRSGQPLRPLGRWRGYNPEGRRVSHYGYIQVRVPRDTPGARGGWMFEHRKVMAEILGRPLRSEETVHHINGDRTDNRPENLELWSKSHPPGQRVADKLAWAREIVALYGGDGV